MDKPITRTEILALIRSGLADFEATLARFSEAQMVEAQVEGTWTVKDILAHITAWEGWLFGRLAGPHKIEAAHYTQADVDRINAGFYAESRTRSLAEVRANFQQVHENVLKAVSGLPETLDALAYELVENNTCGHYAEHLVSIRAWLAKAR